MEWVWLSPDSKQGAKSKKRVWNQNHLDKATNPTGARQAHSAGSGPICSFPPPAFTPFLASEGPARVVPQRTALVSLQLFVVSKQGLSRRGVGPLLEELEF